MRKDKAQDLVENANQILVSMHDDELKHYNRPMFFRSRTEALIALRNIVVSGSDPMIEALADVMSAHIIGEFNESTGEIISCRPLLLCRLFDFKRVKKEEKTDDVQDSV